MEDYIFIIIAIVLAIWGAINQSKKKNNQLLADDEDIPQQRPSVFEQLFEDDFFEEAPPTPVQQVPSPEISARQFQPLARPEIRKPAPPPVRPKPIEVIVEKEEKTTNTISALKKDFSLKNAVIYSEILRRKY